jgi:hypothetical protein
VEEVVALAAEAVASAVLVVEVLEVVVPEEAGN